MPGKATRWIGRVAEFRPKDEVFLVPRGVRGIYVLFRRRRRKALARRNQRKVYKDFYDVVYVGLSRSGVRARLKAHRLSRVKGALWSHFSLFQVHARVSDSQIGELEGLFRQIYRRD